MTPTLQFIGRSPTARSVALEVLMRCRQEEVFVRESLDQRFARTELKPADRRLATQIAYGVVRRQATLDALLRPFVTRPADQVEPWLWEALRIGAFQLAVLTQIPVHAAVHETVQLAVAFGRPQARGFLNGVLRRVCELMTPEFVDGPAADALPLDEVRFRRLARPVLPDPATAPVEYLSAAYSLPTWLVERWLTRMDPQACRQLAGWFIVPPAMWLRCNLQRTTRETLLAAFQNVGVAAQAGPVPEAIRLSDSSVVTGLPGYEEGWFAVQDITSMRVALALDPQPGEQILDLCAAPGGKTTHLAERMRNQGRIVACDVDDLRLGTLRQLAERLGITIIETRRLPGRATDQLPDGPFDAILVDVPCSNTGVLGRRPEARWRLRPKDLTYLVPLQRRLLEKACERAKPGGRVVYSTCSIEPEENGAVVRSVMETVPGLTLEAEEEQTPGRPGDGGYWARLRRSV